MVGGGGEIGLARLLPIGLSIFGGGDIGSLVLLLLLPVLVLPRLPALLLRLPLPMMPPVFEEW